MFVKTQSFLTMKKLSLLFSVFILLTAFTCENEPLDSDLSPYQPNNPVQGTWLLTAWISGEPFDINNDGTASVYLMDEFDCLNNETIVFNSNGTGIIFNTSHVDISITMDMGTEDSYEYSIECIEEIQNINMTWTQNGNTVSITESGETSNWTLNGNQLSITVPEGFFVANEDYTETITTDLTFVYTKQ